MKARYVYVIIVKAIPIVTDDMTLGLADLAMPE